MQSPFPKSSSSAGGGNIVVAPLPAGGSGLQVMSFQYPLKLIAPSASSDQRSVLVFLLSYGGGLVGGDAVHLNIDVRSQSKLSLVTQGHTKIFKSPSPNITTIQVMQVTLDEEAALCLLPDPVQPFDGSVYKQTQVFKLAPRSSLCLLDWVTQGRSARGEDWSFLSWRGRNEVWLKDQTAQRKDRLLVRDTMVLEGNGGHSGDEPLREKMQSKGIYGTLILRGPVVEQLGNFFLAELAAMPRLGSRDFRTAEARQEEDEKKSRLEHWRAARIEKEAKGGVLWSAAQVRGCIVVKFAASTVEHGRDWVREMICEDASIEAAFGPDALMCLI